MDESQYAIKLKSSHRADSDIHEQFVPKPAPTFHEWLCYHTFIAALKENDLAWVLEPFDPANEMNPFHFEIVCETMGLDISATRKKLIGSMTEAKNAARREYIKLEFQVFDSPGRIYTHPYKECKNGRGSSYCMECRERYRSSYAKVKAINRRRAEQVGIRRELREAQAG